MTDKFINTTGYQCGCIFKIPFRVAFGFDQEKSVASQKYRTYQADPGKNLPGRKRIEEPAFAFIKIKLRMLSKARNR